MTAAPINIRETGVHRRRFSGRKVEKIMLTLPKCELCARYKDDGKHDTCEEFPDGIPDDVLCEPVKK